MDFASLMSREISKSKKQASQPADKQQNKTYLRRSELEAERLATYKAEQDALQKERDERADRKRKLEEDAAKRDRVRDEKRRRLAEQSRQKREAEEEAKESERRKRLGLNTNPVTGKSETENESTTMDGEEISQEELTEKLRSLGEPIRLFGENDKSRLGRYRNLVHKSVMPQKKLSDGPIPTTLALVPEAEMKVPDKVPTDEEGRKYLYRQLASYFTMVLKEWERAMAKRDDSVKSTFQGRQAYNAMVQSRENMKPLFKKFENSDMEESILEPIVEIVRNAQKRRYVDANDGYLRLSIGKAAWPIGVTMVGIHERSAREKLHEGGSKAHIMSDEITRKFLQSIKRCLTFAQVRWPPDDQLQLMG
ncbi:hypothetical protein LOZ12_000292 [Ophidiomyces ophidiicola]|uniref:Uncharacterized protein n=1 Tax=Ophidiomyces ophidiicola TaxID=1387563 RepID=A0ACB8V416_9EURO|nr:uncharacterized protein LOZ57_000745 [Ophidiomyces ophidiicola]KAI1944772.1 hypothetical protein LOZ62_004050 [Ophidiomyces ophidiicola]KAI1952666.1 hypothetical protein LOZ57_000745 [Ophidiomyces ophidiicola]KAI1975869.1 hypothetical protein LOZ56_000461 [Ophidiomyces ophidiicola]KAI2012097.1 hypothetical protein LOZ50_000419 [Ophidiomyces ophidiicola]KAI2026568.1 hypothetical protein LOZ45_002996 [Ophidiomyces ophidiicola]